MTQLFREREKMRITVLSNTCGDVGPVQQNLCNLDSYQSLHVNVAQEKIC